jgi:NAD(P)H-dependent FMN reductase
MSNPFIPVLLGTARSGRRSAAVADSIVDLMKQRSIMTTLIDVADFRLTATGEEVPGLSTYREQMAAADGLVIVAPEYNHGYPGELKLLLDSDFAAYVRKPVGLVTVSSGRIGGARVAEQLRLLALAFRMVPVSPGLHVVDAERVVGPDGRFASPSLEQVANDMLDEVVWFAEALAPARAAQP